MLHNVMPMRFSQFAVTSLDVGTDRGKEFPFLNLKIHVTNYGK